MSAQAPAPECPCCGGGEVEVFGSLVPRVRRVDTNMRTGEPIYVCRTCHHQVVAADGTVTRPTLPHLSRAIRGLSVAG